MSLTLRFDPSPAFVPGLEATQLAAMSASVEKLRDEVCDIDVKMLAGLIATPDVKRPLDAGFYLLPEQLLGEYAAEREQSSLGQMLVVTKALMAAVDRVVVLTRGGACRGAQALLAACCQPYFNELTRGQRGSRPRIYFDGHGLDNDATQGLLYLLGAHRGQAAGAVEDSWGLVVVESADEARQVAAAAMPFLDALEVNCGAERTAVAKRVISVARGNHAASRAATMAAATHRFAIPPGVGNPFSLLSGAGLIPAALMGINVMKLLDGARVMNEHFRTAKAADNVVLQFAAINHLLATRCDVDVRVTSVWTSALEAAGKWYAQLLADSLGKGHRNLIPLTLVCPRDLPGRYQAPTAGGRKQVTHHIMAEQDRFDPLSMGGAPIALDATPAGAEMCVRDLLQFAHRRSAQALQAEHQPATNIFLPRVDEFCMGQYFQMMMLATVIEGRLLGINPYSRPAADAY